MAAAPELTPPARSRPFRRDLGVRLGVVMEAAIRLPLTQVYVRNGRLQIEQLTVDDETAVRLAADRDDAARFVTEAI